MCVSVCVSVCVFVYIQNMQIKDKDKLYGKLECVVLSGRSECVLPECDCVRVLVCVRECVMLVHGCATSQ